MGHHEVFKRVTRAVASSVIGLVLSISFVGAAGAAELHVPIDETKAFVLDKPVSTVAVTNPSIADVSIHNDKIVLVLGRTFGTTNIVALDADGVPVATKRIRVTSPGGAANVTYVRGPGIFSYTCAPRCERIVLPGDRNTLQNPDIGPTTASEGLNQTSNRSTQAKKSSE